MHRERSIFRLSRARGSSRAWTWTARRPCWTSWSAMLLADVNVLVYAHRADAPSHQLYRQWLEDLMTSDQAYATSDVVLSGFVRVVTHPRVFTPSTSLEAPLAFTESVREQPNAVSIFPGDRHWDIFKRLCHQARGKGTLVPDADLAAMAIEPG